MRKAWDWNRLARRRIHGVLAQGKAVSLLCAALCAGLQAHADSVPSEQADRVWLAASDRQLDDLRGGFSLGEGLTVSFGISRVTYINDLLVASTQLNLGPITRLTAQQAAILQVPIASTLEGTAALQLGAGAPAGLQSQWIQNGPGNFLQSDSLGAMLATVIQNSLNDQLLRTQTIINVSSNSLGILRGLNLQRTLDVALTNALAGR